MKDLPLDEICNLYVNKKISSTKIAKKFGCSKATILKRLKVAKIQMRAAGVPRLKVSDEELKLLYLEKGLSTWKIGELLKCGRSTIHRKLRKMGVIKDIATAHMRYPRKPFSGDSREKAYMTGFVVGDLRVRKVGKRSRTIKIDCASTRKEQIELVNNLFSRYGKVWISTPRDRGIIQIEAFLDDSFGFLLDCRKNLDWVFSKRFFIPFLAGFTDAEGSIFITNKKAVYALGNYDEELLRSIRKELLKHGIMPTKVNRAKKTYVTEGYKQRQHYCILHVNRKKSLLKLFNILGPYIRHKKRKKDMKKALKNIILRDK